MSELGSIGPDFPPDHNYRLGWRVYAWMTVKMAVLFALIFAVAGYLLETCSPP